MRTIELRNPAVLCACVLAGAACAFSARVCRAADTPIEQRHVLYDVAAPSAKNPVIARVDLCRIEITQAEFRGYLAQVPPNETLRILTLDEKRALVQDLVNDHLLLW